MGLDYESMSVPLSLWIHYYLDACSIKTQASQANRGRHIHILWKMLDRVPGPAIINDFRFGKIVYVNIVIE